MTLRQKYRKSPDAAINYDWFDIESGTGVKTFYGMASNDTATRSYHLQSEVAFSEAEPELTETVIGSLDIDLDTSTFNSQRAIKGDVMINITWMVTKNTATTANRAGGYLTFQLKKYDGSSETNIGSTVRTTTMQTASISGTGGSTFRTSTLIIPVSNTTINKGDLVRLTITGTEDSTFSDITGVRFVFNPQNSSTLTFTINQAATASAISATITYTTQLLLILPFKIDL